MARPSLFNESVAEEICVRLACGDSLAKICRDDEMPAYRTVMTWLRQNEAFRQQYVQAREDQADADADAVSDIGERALNGEIDAQAARVSPGGLNSAGESDLRNYYDRIAAGQTLEMGPALTRLDEALIRSATGTRDPAIHYDWNPLWQLSEKDKADIFKTKSDAARTIAGNGGTSEPLMPIEALSDALVNELVEDGSLAGLEAAIEEYGKLGEQDDDGIEERAASGLGQEFAERSGDAGI